MPSLCVWYLGLARVKVSLQSPLSSLFLTCIFLGSRYYRVPPRYYRRARYYRNQNGSNFLLPLVEQYYRPRCGTSARAVLPRSHERVGVKSGQGEFQLRHTHSTLFPHAFSLSPAQERRRRTSPDLRLRPLSSHSDRWDRSPPRPLAMDPGISPGPSLFAPLLCF